MRISSSIAASAQTIRRLRHTRIKRKQPWNNNRTHTTQIPAYIPLKRRFYPISLAINRFPFLWNVCLLHVLYFASFRHCIFILHGVRPSGDWLRAAFAPGVYIQRRTPPAHHAAAFAYRHQRTEALVSFFRVCHYCAAVALFARSCSLTTFAAFSLLLKT